MMAKKNVIKVVLVGLILALVGLIHYFGLHSYLTLAQLKLQQDSLQVIYGNNKILFIAAYMAIYIISTGLSIPGATILTLAGGALFGSFLGTGIIVLSATLGASLAFLAARFLFRESLESRYASNLKKFNTGVEENAWNYLLFLRLIPLFPFFLINIVLGLTRIDLRVFFIGSFFGMLPGTFVYANAGYHLSKISSVKDITSPELLGAFLLLGVFALVPIVYKKVKKK
ncbi:MAG: putative membrane protein YdjX (TVP38/TMEM64 family) [Candidatus Marinamargulisbacteria bacterium]|jgi:uncharacterized membrane protein YdjX (TVP38/TMEM64 family)